MNLINFLGLFLVVLISSCQNSTEPIQENEGSPVESKPKWTLESLEERTQEHLDSNLWNRDLLNSDIDLFEQYGEAFESLPLSSTAFPVADYDYSVAGQPFSFQVDTAILNDISIGDYPNPDSDDIRFAATLLVLSNLEEPNDNYYVVSRNYPYLTAQGTFETVNSQLDWVFTESPDGFSTLLVNMKLFDLRFGETVLIIPQKDGSFQYYQFKEGPNDHEDFESFKLSLKKNKKLKELLNTKNTIQ
jgi:hypothetical protein